MYVICVMCRCLKGILYSCLSSTEEALFSRGSVLHAAWWLRLIEEDRHAPPPPGAHADASQPADERVSLLPYDTCRSLRRLDTP